MDHSFSPGLCFIVITTLEGVEVNVGTDLMKGGIAKASFTWFLLLILTSIAIIFSRMGIDHNALLKVVLVITIVKGILVADVFMGLSLAPKIWYRMMASYLILVPLGIFLIYFLSAA